MTIRTCKYCGFTGDESLFRKKNNCCKKCQSEYNKKYSKQWRSDNSEKLKKDKLDYYYKNLDKIKEKNLANRDARLAKRKKYREVNREKLAQKQKDYAENNREIVRANAKISKDKNKHKYKPKARERHKERMKTDIQYRFKHNLRTRIVQAIKYQSAKKSSSTMELLGCDIMTVRKRLESLFTESMTWENHGLYGWHIDHIRPCSSFDLTDPEQQKKCFHYTNLQPLWAEDNLRKNDLIILTKEDLA